MNTWRVKTPYKGANHPGYDKVEAAAATVGPDGTLMFHSHGNDLVRSYRPDQWKEMELDA